MSKLRIHYAIDAYSAKHRQANQRKIVKLLRKFGHVINEHTGSGHLCRKHAIKTNTKKGVMTCGNTCLENADILVANVTARSHGVGRKIERANWLNKTVICLYDHNRAEHEMSDFIDGDDQIWLIEFSGLADLESQLENKFATIRLNGFLRRRRQSAPTAA